MRPDEQGMPGGLDTGKFADIVAVPGSHAIDAANNAARFGEVHFVMRAGVIHKSPEE